MTPTRRPGRERTARRQRSGTARKAQRVSAGHRSACSRAPPSQMTNAKGPRGHRRRSARDDDGRSAMEKRQLSDRAGTVAQSPPSTKPPTTRKRKRSGRNEPHNQNAIGTARADHAAIMLAGPSATAKSQPIAWVSVKGAKAATRAMARHRVNSAEHHDPLTDTVGIRRDAALEPTGCGDAAPAIARRIRIEGEPPSDRIEFHTNLRTLGVEMRIDGAKSELVSNAHSSRMIRPLGPPLSGRSGRRDALLRDDDADYAPCGELGLKDRKHSLAIARPQQARRGSGRP